MHTHRHTYTCRCSHKQMNQFTRPNSSTAVASHRCSEAFGARGIIWEFPKIRGYP